MSRFAGYKLDQLDEAGDSNEMRDVTPYLEALDIYFDKFVRMYAPQEADAAPSEKNHLIRRHFHNIHASLDRRLLPTRDSAAVAAGESVLHLYWAYHNNMVGMRGAISSSDDAVNYLAKARDVFEANARPKDVVKCLQYMGLILWLRGHIPQARTYLKDALASPDCTDAMRLDCARAFAHMEYKEGSLLKAVDLYADAIRAAKGVGDELAVIRSEIGLMDVHRKLGDYSTAEAAFSRIESNLEGVPRSVRGNAVRGLAYVKLAKENFSEAERLYGEALGLFDPVSAFGQAHCRRGLGDVYVAQRRFELAEVEFTRALELYDEARKNPSLGTILVLLGQGRLAYAREYFTEALGIFEGAARMLDKQALNEPYELAVARELQGDTFFRTGRLNQAHGQFAIAAAQFARMEASSPRDRVEQKIAKVLAAKP